MKTAIFLFFLLVMYATVAKAQTPPPVSIKGQSSTSKLLPKWNLQVPSKQATNLGGIDALIETGNTNILENPSFEHSTATTGWSSAVTGTATNTLTAGSNSTNELGAKRLNFSCAGGASGGTCTISQDQNTSKTVQGLALAYISTDTPSGVKLKPRANGAEISGLEVSAQTTSEFLYKVPFTLGSSSSGLEVEITVSAGATIAGTVDAAFVGAVDLKADVDQSRIAGESYFAATSSCVPQVTSTTIADFSTPAACPGPTIVRSSMGSWQTTDANGPIQTINDLPAGTYEVTFETGTYLSAATNAALAITDGTTTCASTPLGGFTNVTPKTISCSFTYASSGNRTFKLRGASGSGTLSISGDDASGSRGNIRFILKYFGSGSVYTSTNADTDWASCGHTTSDFTGFGTVTNIETQCKREGSDLLMRGKFTSGTSTAVEARLNLKLGGTSLTSASSSVIPSLQYAGDLVQAFTAAGYARNSVLIEPSVGYVTFGYQSASLNAATKVTGAGGFNSNTVQSFFARIPISGWTNSNIIVGSFAEMVGTPGVTKPRVCSFKFGGASIYTSCTSSPCTVYQSKGSCVSSVTRTGNGLYTVNWNTGIWGDNEYTCGGTLSTWSSGAAPGIHQNAAQTTTSMPLNLTNSANVDGAAGLVCLGAAP